MAASASSPDGSDFLSPGERQTLAAIEDAMSATDPHLAHRLTDRSESIMLPPTWLVWLGRVAFIMLPVTLLVPYKWWGWAALAVLAALVAAPKWPRSPNVH